MSGVRGAVRSAQTPSRPETHLAVLPAAPTRDSRDRRFVPSRGGAVGQWRRRHLLSRAYRLVCEALALAVVVVLVATLLPVAVALGLALGWGAGRWASRGLRWTRALSIEAGATFAGAAVGVIGVGSSALAAVSLVELVVITLAVTLVLSLVRSVAGAARREERLLLVRAGELVAATPRETGAGIDGRVVASITAEDALAASESALRRTFDSVRATGVVIAPSALQAMSAEVLVARLRTAGLPVHLLLEGVAEHRVSARGLRRGYATTVLTVAPSGSGLWTRCVGWLLDRVLAALLLLLCSPLLAVLAIAVRLDSRGPAWFHQVRIGRNGQPFTMHKLRTMYQGAESVLEQLQEWNEAEGPLFKVHDDPRITRVGRWLRRSSLDELPQLWNVVKGEMSLVGPRPALPREAAEYDAVTARRLSVRPGITGPWQVGGRSDLPWDQAVALDLAYVDNETIVGDLAICSKTVAAVLRADGAY